MGDETLSGEELDQLLENAEIISDDTGEYGGIQGGAISEEYSDDHDDYSDDIMPETYEAPAVEEEYFSSVQETQSQAVQQLAPKPPVSDEVIVGKFSNQQRHNADLLMDIYVQVTVELGRTAIKVKDVLGLGEGSIIELNKPANEPVDLLVNNRLVARGEVVVIDENFGARVTNIVNPNERIVVEDF